MNEADDARWMSAALALAERSHNQSAPNPNVGCVIVKDDRVVGRGWTQFGGRPHAEAVALAQSGEAARGATVYVTLEPCAHESVRGLACTDSLINAGVARVVIALIDPDPRTQGAGAARLVAAGITLDVGIRAAEARRCMAGWLMQRECARPYISLKIATSLDGCIAMHTGESRWITGVAARAHAHLERARCGLIIVGRGTVEADSPRLDVRLLGLEGRAPTRAVLTRGLARADWLTLSSPEAIIGNSAHYALIEGGAGAAAAFLKADLVDRLLLYRAPILIGGKSALGDFGLTTLDAAHGRWRRTDSRNLGSDTLDVYERTRGES